MTRTLSRLADWFRRQPVDVWCYECDRLTEGGGLCNWCQGYLDGCQINDEPDRGDRLRA